MDVNSYCENLTTELNGWKAKVEEIVARLDKAPSGDKGKVLSQVNDLHALIEQFEDRIGRLKEACPVEWSPDKIELDNKLTEIKNVCEECWSSVSGADVGG